MFVFVLVCITLCPFWFFNHLDEEERAGCFALLSFGYLVTTYALWLFLTVPLVGLQFVIVIFSDHVHFIKANIVSKSLQSPSDLFRALKKMALTGVEGSSFVL